METSNPQDGQVRAMALIASLRTAVEVCRAFALRHAGEDPSQQEESASVYRRLRESRGDLREALLQLRLSLAAAFDEETALVRAFEDRMLLAHAARELHMVHQRLLSLYPAVDERSVERARILQAEAARLAAGDRDVREAAALWADSAELLIQDLLV